MNTISIIVPVYNVEQYLHRCIDSIISQSYANWELILIDDGSPDRCPQICDYYAEKDKRIKVIHKINGGLSEARNYGLDIATGDYITFVDSDDFIHQNMLNDMVQLAIANNADIVQCQFIRGNDNFFPSISRKEKIKLFDNHSIFSSSFQKVILCAKLYKKDLWKEIRMPIGIIHEDDATTWKLYYLSKNIVVTNIPYYYYYYNPNSIMNSRKKANLIFINIYEERIVFFQKQKEEALTTLSKWRFCLPLMCIFVKGKVTKSEEDLLLCKFRENIKDVVNCRYVPLKHRIILQIFRISPVFYRSISKFLGKAETIKIDNHEYEKNS